jgi:hypothetical protein
LGQVETLTVSFGGQSVLLEYPADWGAELRLLFGWSAGSHSEPHAHFTLTEDQDGRFELREDGRPALHAIEREDVPTRISEFVTHRLAKNIGTGVALHGGVVGWHGCSILVPGNSGSGKSSLVAWFVEAGFDFLTDELAVLAPDGVLLSGFPRALMLRADADAVVGQLSPLRYLRNLQSGTRLMLRPDSPASPHENLPCRLMIFPSFLRGAALKLEPIRPVDAAMRLMTFNTNAGNLADGGLAAITRLVRRVPAIALHYGDFAQLTGVIDTLAKLLLADEVEPDRVERLILALARSGAEDRTSDPGSRTIPAPTPKRAKASLTIGMPTYDDYDGVYFTLQALRMYHPEIAGDAEFIVVDNHPDGACAKSLKALEKDIPNYRYVPEAMRSGTAVKGRVFDEASAEFVVCMDCHVFVVPGAIRRLLQYFMDNRSTPDLLQGPLIRDDFTTIATQMRPEWRGGMYGVWDNSGLAPDPDAPPFEIPMQGMGLFACRRAAWPGFHDAFHGWGAEEGYIHAKFRQAGARTLCLPFLRWMHRFSRPMGIPYRYAVEDRIWNYLIGFGELGLPTAEMEAHFRGLLGEPTAGIVFERLKRQLAGRGGKA